MVASDPYKFHEIFNKFSFEAFFLKKRISQYKAFEKVAAYRRFRGL